MDTKEVFAALDDSDWRIIDCLRANARVSFTDLGRQVHLSLAAVAERVRKLEERGVILGYHAALNPLHLGLPVQAFLRVSSSQQNCQRVVALARALPEVREAYRVTGTESYVLKVFTPSVAHLEHLIDQFLALGDVMTSLILSEPVAKASLERVPLLLDPTQEQA